jgi:hypothetical protein
LIIALAAAALLRHAAFVPPPKSVHPFAADVDAAKKLAVQRAAALVAPAMAAVAASAPALATTGEPGGAAFKVKGVTGVGGDVIGVAAAKLSEAAYPLMKEIDWNSYTYLVKPGSAGADAWVKAIDKAIVMGASMDPKLLKEAVMLHHKAIGSIKESKPVLSMNDFTDINAAIGRIIASVPEDQVMAVYNSFSGVVSADVPKYLMSTVKEQDAKAAYAALMEFKDVVKKNPIKPTVPATPAELSSKFSGIDAAAGKLSSAAYPFIKDVDWTSDLALKPLPGASPNQVLKAIDKALVMGASMDGKLLKEAAEAHHKAIGSVDAKLVTSASDFAAVNAALGKVIASVPTSKVMDVYNAFGKILSPVVPNYLYGTVNPNDAQAAYAALLKFKDVVKAAQPVCVGSGLGQACSF